MKTHKNFLCLSISKARMSGSVDSYFVVKYNK